MIRALLGLLAALLLAGLLALAWLAGTTAGARWLAERATAELPGLELRVERGSLWQGLDLRGVAWEGGGIAMRAERLAFAWRPLCLLDARVCLDRLAAAGVEVTVTADAQPGEETAGGAEPISLPVTVLLRELDLERIRVETPAAEVALERLRSAATLAGDRLRVGETRLSGLTVSLPESGAEPARGTPPGTPGDAVSAPVALPAVTLPLAVTISDLALTDGRLQRGGQGWALNRLALAGAFAGGRLRLERLALAAPQGEASLSGEVTTRGDWPLDLALDARAGTLAAGEPLALTARLRGSAADLDLGVTLTEPASARLEARLRPLQSAPAWRATLTADALQWPLAGAPQVSAEGLRASGEGSGTDYRLEASAGIAGPQIPAGRYRLDLRGDAEGAEILGLEGELLGGRIGVAGEVGWSGDVRWDLALALGGLDPGQWRPGLEGRLGGHLRVSGVAGADGWSVDARLPGIAGELRGFPFSLRGALAGDSGGRWRFQGLELASGGNRLALDGTLAERWDARLSVDAPRLERLWPGLAGVLRGEVALGGPAALPDVSLDLRAQGLAYQDIELASARLRGEVRERFEAASVLTLRADGAARAGEALGDLRAELSGRRGAHRLTLDASGGPVPASLALQGGLGAALEAWEGQLERARLALPDGDWRLAGPAALAWRRSDHRVSVAAHCWERGPARLCATEALHAGPAGARARLALEGYPLAALDPWLPEGLGIEATLAGEAAIDWEPGGLPEVDLALRSADGALVLADEEIGESVRFAYRRIDVGLVLEAGRARLDLAVASAAFGSGELQARVDPRDTPRALDGRIRLSGVDLAPLAAFLPQLRELQGVVAVEGDLGGTLGAPAFDGELRLDDGRVALRDLASPLEAIRLRARVDGDTATLEGSFRAGDGTARLAGELGWRDGPRGEVTLAGEGLEFRYQSIARVRMSPDLRVALAPGSVEVSGELAVPWGRIRIQELPAGAVPVSGDVVIVGEGDAEETVEEAPGWAITTDIRVRLGDDVRFEGFGAEGRLAGDLRLRQIGAADTEAEGEIRFEDGRFSAYGQRLEIRRGRFLFAGPIAEPQLDIEAIRRVETVVAGLRVSGSASDPQVTLFSEPPMPQADILAYLITGRPPGGGTPSEEALVAQAALSLGVFGGRNVGGALAEQLGVEDFQLETSGQGEAAEVAVSGFIAPNLLVRYGVGVFQPQNTLTLRYYLTERLFVEAVSGAESALDIFYSFDF